MITFNKLSIEGFGSMIKRNRFNLNQPGLNIIRGKVGSGKTTIPSALTWVLYGRTLKEGSQVETWSELRSKDYNGTKVMISFTKGENNYMITRCLNYKGNIKIGDKTAKGASKLILHKNGEPSNTRNKRDLQKDINKLLGYSFDLFKNSVVFGQRVKRIIEESGPDKKKIFEEAFEVSFIEEARANVKEQNDKLVVSFTELDGKMDNVIDKIESTKEQYKDALDYEKEFAKNKRLRLKELKSTRGILKQRLNDLTGSDKHISKSFIKKCLADKERLEGLISKYKSAQDKYAGLNNAIKTLDNELSGLTIKNKKCPVCKSVLNKDAKEKIAKKALDIGKEIKELQEKASEMSIPRIEGVLEELKAVEWQISKNEEFKANNKSNKNQIDNINSKLVKLGRKLEKLEKSKLVVKSTKFKKKLDKLELAKEKLNLSMKGLKSEMELNGWLIKDPLSNNGLKAYMFDSMLNNLNNKLEEYSNILGFQVAFGIDLESSRKDFYQAIERDGIIIPYEDLSGGQKQLVDTTVALAIHDVISEMRPTNIVFMDEPFESLDEDNVDIIEEIIENKAKGKSLFLITHKLTFNPLNANEISFELDSKKNTVFK